MHRIAIIGLGMAVKPHVLATRDLAARVEVAAGFSRSAERRAAFAKSYGLPISDDLDAVLADRSIDTVMILTPPWAHLELVQRCAAAGKHILLEKPIEATLARAIETVETCERAGVKLAIVFQHRFRKAALVLAELVAAGRLGRLVSCSASIRWWRSPEYFAQAGRGMKARDGGGVLLTQAIHTLDLMLSLTGPVAELSAFHRNSGLRKIDTEDVAAGALRFASGAIGAIDATSTAFPGYPERIELAGDKGSALLETERLRVELMDGTVIEEGAVGGGGGGADPMAFNHEANTRLLADFLDAIDADRAPRTHGRSALHVHRLIDAMLSSNGQTVRLDASAR
jgi:UDP-N-acetyl-2-amino-2-deoxyglucuronate dehydrogenase